MPHLYNIIAQTPENAIDAAIQNTVKRANDVWGLDYASKSGGLYPAGNQIGRTQFRPDFAYDGELVFPKIAGGKWRTVNNPNGDKNGPAFTLTTSATTGWAHWLNWNINIDAFLVLEGLFSQEVNPSIHEVSLNLNGTQLPIVNVDSDLYATEERTLRGFYEVPVVASPTSQVVVDIRSDLVGLTSDAGAGDGAGLDEGFGLIGDIVAKRPLLIKQTF